MDKASRPRRRHPRTAGAADAPHLCTSKRYDPKTDELSLGTDAVDVVVKATVARAGQIAAATENSIAEPAPSTAETSAGSSVPMFGRAATRCQRLVRIIRRALETRRSKMHCYSITWSARASSEWAT